MIMRYQRISPDSQHVNNGRRTNSPSNPNWKTCKEEEDKVETYSNWYMKTSSTFEGKGISRFRSPSKSTPQDLVPEHPNYPLNNDATTNQQNVEANGVVGNGGGGESFLQWGHKKRSRCSRGITLADDTSSSSTTSGVHLHPAKIQRRSSSSSIQLSPNANLMPPPSLPSNNSTNGIHTGTTLKSQARNNSSNPSPLRRNLEERSQSGGVNRSISGRSRAVKRTTPFVDKKNPPPPPPPPCSSSSISAARDYKKMNGCSLQLNQEAVTSDGNHFLSPPQQQGGGCINDGKLAAGAAVVAAGGGGGGKVNGGGGGGVEVNEWPRIYIPLSRKEKEEDFLVFKGTKLPHRPKKRPKAIDRIIQYCYPGMWLPDLSKGRYEVREKKSSKKQKRRGLKGMESMESDSE